jgi:hypothetical protein
MPAMSILTQQRTPARPAGEPTVAALLTWFLPGGGHLYLGRTTFGLLAFLVVEGLYLVGLKLSDGMGFEFLHDELRGAFAPFLAPEAGNLGALLYQKQAYDFGPGFPRPFPSTVAVGSMLTAMSGMLNVALMCHAHFEARLPRGEAAGKRSPALAVLLTWLLPGLGHLWQGRRLRGLLVMLMLVGLVAFGTLLAEGSNLSRERHYFYWGGQFLAGLPALLPELLAGGKQLAKHVAYGEAGLVIASVAGMLNVLAMIDVFAWGEEHELGAKAADAPAESASPEGVTA